MQWQRVPVWLDSKTGKVRGRNSQLYVVVDGERYDIKLNKKQLRNGHPRLDNGMEYEIYGRLTLPDGPYLGDYFPIRHFDDESIFENYVPPFVYIMVDSEDEDCEDEESEEDE